MPLKTIALLSSEPTATLDLSIVCSTTALFVLTLGRAPDLSSSDKYLMLIYQRYVNNNPREQGSLYKGTLSGYGNQASTITATEKWNGPFGYKSAETMARTIGGFFLNLKTERVGVHLEFKPPTRPHVVTITTAKDTKTSQSGYTLIDTLTGPDGSIRISISWHRNLNLLATDLTTRYKFCQFRTFALPLS